MCAAATRETVATAVIEPLRRAEWEGQTADFACRLEGLRLPH